jgi:ligand-binding sensor domain-containing protein
LNFSQFRRSLLTFSCSFLILTQIFAQEVRDNFISGLNNVNEKNNFSIDVKDNFSSGTIYDIKKDSKDRIWLATNKGIYVSDGMNFIQIIIGDVNVTNSAIKELIVEGENMFLLFQDKGLVKLNVNSLSYTKITDKPVSSLIIEKNHNAILVTKGK